jgi:hypothetical protein
MSLKYSDFLSRERRFCPVYGIEIRNSIFVNSSLYVLRETNLKYEDRNENHHHSCRVPVSTVTRRHHAGCALYLDPDGSVGDGDDRERADLEEAEDCTCQTSAIGTQIETAPMTTQLMHCADHRCHHHSL